MNLTTELNKEVFAQIAQAAAAAIDPHAAHAARWIKAIKGAVTEVEINPYVSYDPATHVLVVMSRHSGETYLTNGVCQCEAYKYGQPCVHRALKRLMMIYVERGGISGSSEQGVAK